MNYFIFPLQSFALFISINFPLMVSFPDDVADWVGTFSGDVKIIESPKDKKTLIIQGITPGLKTGIAVITKHEKYYLKLVQDEAHFIPQVRVFPAMKDNGFRLKAENQSYKLLEGRKSRLIINKTSTPIKVNDLVVHDQVYLNKGPPIFVNQVPIIH